MNSDMGSVPDPEMNDKFVNYLIYHVARLYLAVS